MTNYASLPAALARAKERSGATAADDVYLSELLDLSAGVNPAGVTQYRPFLVAARWMEQNQARQSLSSADGVVFTGLAKPIASLLALQASIDAALGLAIPDGFAATVATTARYATRSLPTTARP